MAHECPPAPITTPMLTGPSFADPIITTEGDRGLPTWPWVAWFNQLLQCIAHAEGGLNEVVFNLAAGSVSVQVGTNVTPPRVIQFASSTMKLLEVNTKARDVPTGAALIMDILVNGVSIFGDEKLTIPAGFSGIVTRSDFVASPLPLEYHDVITMDVIQTGTGERGRAIFVGMKYTN